MTDRNAPTLAEGRTAVEDEPMVVSLKHAGESGERYVTIGELGRGGMGEITLCLDRRIGRRVALKRSRAGANADRFVREAYVQGQLEHPTVVPLYDLTLDAAETSFTMKRVRGLTLRAILSGLTRGDPAIAERFTQRKLLSDFASVCLGVAFAHDHGVVHRDLKPENLMLGDYGEVYVLDWGVAKIADAASLAEDPIEHAAAEHATAAGSLIGTAGYMSPEQCIGENETLDGRSDVYALGAILFEILTLDRLHHGKTTRELFESTLLGADARSTRAPEREIPPELEAMCVRATATRREERFATARELHDAIQRYLDWDRDVELRRTMAARHAEAATNATDRKRALSEAGRALALDPTNDEAQRIVVRLLTEPPERVPPEAQQQIDASFDGQRRVTARTAIPTMLLFSSFAPPLVAMGVRRWPAFVAFFVATAAFLALAWITSRMKRPGNRMVIVLAFTTAALNVASASIFGPLVATPTLAILSTVALVSNADRHRWLVVLLGVVPIVLPLVAAWLGAIPASYGFSGGAMQVLPMMVSLSPTWSIVLLLAMNLASLVGASLFTWRLRQNRVEAERKVIVNAWQLRHLVPTTTD